MLVLFQDPEACTLSLPESALTWCAEIITMLKTRHQLFQVWQESALADPTSGVFEVAV